VLGDSAANPKFIETLARRGYRFVGPAVSVVESTQPPEQPLALGRWPLAEASDSKIAPFAGEQPGLKPSEDLSSSSGLKPRAASTDERLPAAPRTLVRTLFALAQVMYLSFYVVGLARLHEVDRLAAELIEGGGRGAETTVLITASAGIAVRLYLLTAVMFDYQPLGWKFRRIFPLVLVLDFIWALSPYLLMPWIGAGLATAACAALLYLPFSQRTLVRMAYRS
jgi:hypothetical protein